MKRFRMLAAVVAAAFLGGGAMAFLIASAFRVAPRFPSVEEGQSSGVAETSGDPILAFTRLDGHGLVSLHDEAIRPRAAFSLAPGGNPDIALLDAHGEERVTFALTRLDEEEITGLVFGSPRSALFLSVSSKDNEGMAALAGGGGLVRMGVRGVEESLLSLRGPDKKSSLLAGFAGDGTPRLALTDREGRERLALAVSEPTRKDRP